MSDLDLLKKAYAYEGSLRKLSDRTGKSPATWQTLLNCKYKYDPKKLFNLLKEKYGFLLNEEVVMVKCPAIRGEIHPSVCKKYKMAAQEGKQLNDRIYAICKNTCTMCTVGVR